ncbi:MAG: 50S ribosomal protein L37e [Candidatus Marsarchaeota archaeon]
MSNGTAAMGRGSNKKTHVICRRCGRHTFNIHTHRCSSCGFGATPRFNAKKRGAPMVSFWSFINAFFVY